MPENRRFPYRAAATAPARPGAAGCISGPDSGIVGQERQHEKQAPALARPPGGAPVSAPRTVIFRGLRLALLPLAGISRLQELLARQVLPRRWRLSGACTRCGRCCRLLAVGVPPWLGRRPRLRDRCGDISRKTTVSSTKVPRGWLPRVQLLQPGRRQPLPHLPPPAAPLPGISLRLGPERPELYPGAATGWKIPPERRTVNFRVDFFRLPAVKSVVFIHSHRPGRDGLSLARR